MEASTQTFRYLPHHSLLSPFLMSPMTIIFPIRHLLLCTETALIITTIENDNFGPSVTEFLIGIEHYWFSPLPFPWLLWFHIFLSFLHGSFFLGHSLKLCILTVSSFSLHIPLRRITSISCSLFSKLYFQLSSLSETLNLLSNCH